jgi:uncharacterized protein YdaU (DUF1376 family)
MTRAFIAFYTGDYQRKTQHLTTLQHGAYFLLLQHCWANDGRIPLEPESRAAIARMTLPEWKKIAPVVDRFFDAGGYNKRASEEVAKAEMISTKRALAGAIGGHRSGTSKAIARGKQLLSRPEANAMPLMRQTPKQNPGICEASQNKDLKTTTDRVERAEGSRLAPTPQLLAIIRGRTRHE